MTAFSRTLKDLDRRWRAPFQNRPIGDDTRRRAWWDMMLLDHGFLRVAFSNLHRIAPGVWRSNQPSPRDIDRLAAQGLKTIINFRDASHWGSYWLEKEAAERHGIELIDIRLYSGAPPNKETVYRLNEIFNTAPRPMLLHCKSGADRAGLGAALFLILAEGVPVAEAKRQLALRYLHMPFGRTGILDFFLDSYLADTAETRMPFLDWIRDVYDQKAMEAAYRPTGLGTFITDKVLGRE